MSCIDISDKNYYYYYYYYISDISCF